MDVPCLTVAPSAPHSHTVVFVHGRGDNVNSFVAALARARDSQGRTLADAFPSFRWVFPQAPTRVCAANPSNARPQCFDVWDTRDFASREELQADGLRESVPAIQRILADEVKLLGGQWDRVVLAGISMGGATSVHTLFNLQVPSADGRLGAFLGFSCRPHAGADAASPRPRNATLEASDTASHVLSRVLCNTPMLLEHCANDPVVPVANGCILRDTLQGFGAQVLWKEYPSGGYWFNSPSGMDDVVDFLNKHVPGLGTNAGV
ncbi:hypothetical protein SCUCBS95973_000392 [Sporothrix curviconia]|uniref:Phospholipase/carboxylesterase/thioesterase domain-containing protein n=1 Tax=Sporothrix curviconia TaxID=1260050 RepID=A0ABP0APW8_9PEZI